MPVKSNKPFPETVQSLLQLEGISRRELARRAIAHGWKRDQSSIARLVSGEIAAQPEHLEAIAKTLLIQPETFAEYRLWKARSEYDPSVIGWEQAIKNLERWEGAVGLADPPLDPDLDEPEASPRGRAGSA